MGILKIGYKILVADINDSPNYHPLDVVKNNSPASGPDSGEDSDDFDLAEENCEPAMVEGQICSIPYELYDLPDLKEVLSVDTWNSCLTEDERFFLSAYLPDVDQETFTLTIKELLDGTDIYFGNPTAKFFERLRGGLYPPTVAHLRECLQFFQRKKYIYSLRSYHENMVRIFTDMRRVWNQCEKNMDIGQRLHVWSKWRKQQELHLLDLNAVPADGYIFDNELNVDATCRFLNGMKSEESKSTDDTFPSLTPNGGSKDIPKSKASKNSVLQNRSPKVAFNGMLEHYRSAPKGLLKVVPKGLSDRANQHNVVQSHLLQTPLTGREGLQDNISLSLPASIYLGGSGGFLELPSLRRKVDACKTQFTTGLPKCVLNRQDTLSTSGLTQSPTRRVKSETYPFLDNVAESENADSERRVWFGANNSRDCTPECDLLVNKTGKRKHSFTAQNMWKNLGTVNKELSARSMEQYAFGVPNYLRDQGLHTIREECTSVHSRFLTPRILNQNSGAKESTTSSSKPKNGQNDVRIPLINLSNHNEPEGVKSSHSFPLTYKRKKVPAKV